MTTPIVVTEQLGHSYGDREALRNLDLAVNAGEMVALLGPNGGGKSTLFRILATLLRPTTGTARILGHDVREQPARVRRAIGVAFQSPSLDPHLTVRENMRHQGHLYGMRGSGLAERIEQLVAAFGIQDRLGDRVGTLSGGLARRVDLAKVLLHRPPLILLDEPSTGLDPTVRAGLLELLRTTRDEHGTTVFLTTHLLEEAAQCDSVVIVDRGRLVADGSPGDLVREIGGEIITLTADDAPQLAEDVGTRFGLDVEATVDGVRVERENAAAFLPELLGAFPDRIRAATVAYPTLSDVFFRRTGRAFSEDDHV